jgi:hypothetical protein
MTQRIRFYENEDLGRLSDGRSAIEWTVMFARMKNREMLLQVLEDTGRSAKVPSFMIQYALGFGMQEKDAEIIAKGRSMYPRMVTQDPKDKATVDRLMMMTSGGTTRTR